MLSPQALPPEHSTTGLGGNSQVSLLPGEEEKSGPDVQHLDIGGVGLLGGTGFRLAYLEVLMRPDTLQKHGSF